MISPLTESAGASRGLQARRCVEEARRCVDLAEGGVPFALTLGTRFELGLGWLVPALGPLAAARPERTIHLRFGDTGELRAGLRADRIDAVVSSMRLAEAGFEHAMLHPEAYAFVGAPALLARLPLVRPSDAAAHPLLDISPDLPLFGYLRDTGTVDWPFAGASYLGTIAAIRARAIEATGVAVLPAYFVADALASGALTPILPDHPLRADAFRLVSRSGHPSTRELRALADELKKIPLA